MENTRISLQEGTILHGHTDYTIEQVLDIGSCSFTYLASAYMPKEGDLGAASTTEKVVIKELFDFDYCYRSANGCTIIVSSYADKKYFELFRRKFLRKAMRLNTLQNIHLAKVLDVFQDNDTGYCVMEYIKGENLSWQLHQQGHPFAENEVWNIAHQLLDALEALYARDMLHLDIQPSHIMMEDTGIVKLIGIPNAFRQEVITDDEYPHTIIAPRLAPFEWATKNVGPWTDFYALGGTLYYFLTARVPPSPSDIIDGGTEVFDWRNQGSNEMRSFIQWLMEPLRKKRPQSVAEIRLHY